jgi:hypothetical protein
MLPHQLDNGGGLIQTAPVRLIIDRIGDNLHLYPSSNQDSQTILGDGDEALDVYDNFISYVYFVDMIFESRYALYKYLLSTPDIVDIQFISSENDMSSASLLRQHNPPRYIWVHQPSCSCKRVIFENDLRSDVDKLLADYLVDNGLL